MLNDCLNIEIYFWNSKQCITQGPLHGTLGLGRVRRGFQYNSGKS